MSLPSDLAPHLVHASHRLYERSAVSATDGNLSARCSNGNILVTPSEMCKGDVTPKDLVEVNADGVLVNGTRTPSSELGMHLFVYRERPDVHAIVHAHPPYATGFATARIPFPVSLFPEIILGIGPIPLAPYATPATAEVAASLAPFVKDAQAILLANHGVVTFGATIEEAYRRMEKVEHAAQILFVARLLGGEHLLTPDQMVKLHAAHKPGFFGEFIAETILKEPDKRTASTHRNS